MENRTERNDPIGRKAAGSKIETHDAESRDSTTFVVAAAGGIAHFKVSGPNQGEFTQWLTEAVASDDVRIIQYDKQGGNH